MRPAVLREVFLAGVLLAETFLRDVFFLEVFLRDAVVAFFLREAGRVRVPSMRSTGLTSRRFTAPSTAGSACAMYS